MIPIVELGVCLVTIIVCCWNWKWRVVDTLRGLRKMYRKFEGILISSTTVSSHGEGKSGRVRKKRFEKTFLSAPVIRTQFIKRNYDTSVYENQPMLPGSELQFYKSLLPSRGSVMDGDRSPSSVTSDYTTCCSACNTRNDVPFDKRVPASIDLKNCLECDTQNPNNPWYIRKFAHLVFFWRKWHIGPQYNMVTLKSMLEDERVNEAILEAAKKELKENPHSVPLDLLFEKHKSRAERLVISMRAKQAKHPYFSIYCRFASWIIGKTLGRIYSSILVRQSQLEHIRKARQSGHPIIYLPIHRSHVDYVLVSWALVACDIRSPLVAAGDNLNIPVFHLMMRSVGGFFIKRKLDRKEGLRDNLYRAILQSYMEKSIVQNNDLEFFIEGGRTRSGKPCNPKGGLLSIAVDTLISKKVSDILIVPVNFSYEKLLEGNYIREQLGRPKIKESFVSAALGLWNSVQTKFGNARVDFGRPFSVKEFISSYNSWKSPSPLQQLYSSDSCCSDTDMGNNYSTIVRDSKCSENDLIIDDHRDFINNLAQHVIYDGIKGLCISSTNIIAFLLLNKFREGVSYKILTEEMEILKSEIIARNHDVGFSGDMKDVVKHGLTILGPKLVTRELVRKINPENGKRSTEIILKPITTIPYVLDLAYYSTCLLPIYCMESVIATSILILKRRELRESISEHSAVCTITDLELLTTCIELCGLLQYEFIFQPPCQTLEYAIRKSMEDLKSQGLLRFNRARFNSKGSESDLNFRSIDSVYISQDSNSIQRLQFLHRLIAPILETYSASSQVLHRLVGHEAPEKHLEMEMLAEIKCHLRQQLVKNGESLALDPIRNFVKVLVGWQVLESHTENAILTYFLGEAFDNEMAVDTVIQRIRRFQL